MNTEQTTRPLERLKRQFATALLYLPVSLCICAIAAIAAWHFYEFRYSSAAVIATAILLSPLLIALSPAIRNLVWGAAFCALIAGLLLLGNPAKIAMMHMPLSVADAQALPVLFKTMSGMRLAFAVILVAVVLATILCMLRPKRLTALSITLAVCYVFALPTLISQASPLIDLVLPVQTTEHKMLNGAVVKSNQESDPVAFLRGRGPVVYLASEWQSIHAENGGPSRSEVDALVLRPWQPVR